jgi:tripartite-type tricarboxylate transporter receptor subunit TctC
VSNRLSSLAVVVGLGLLPSIWAEPGLAQEEFYKGKTVRIVVGSAPGGGFDTYARAIARQMGKHVPGNPTVIVENMTGAGSLRSANYLYRIAKPDGLTIGHFLGGLLLGQALGREGIEFDARKFEYLGVPVRESSICALGKKVGFSTIEEWLASKTPVKLGGIAPGNATDDVAKILQAGIGLPIHLVSGYKGTSEVRLAVEGGEVFGVCMGWDSIKATWRKNLESGDVAIVLQATARPHPELPKIPLAVSFAKTQEGRRLIEVGIHDLSAIFRPYVLPPGTPKDRVETLRRAFAETLKDPEFLSAAAKSRLSIDPVSGEEAKKIVAGLFDLPPALVAKLKDVLKW